VESIRQPRIKKAQGFEAWFFVIVVLLAFSLFFLILNKTWGDIKEPLDEGLTQAMPSNSPVNISETLDQVTGANLQYDKLIPLILIGLFGFILISAGAIIRHPIMIFVGVIVLGVVILISVVFSNIQNGTTQNGTAIYDYVKTGSHLETKEVWNKITPADLKKNDKLTIGVFTNVEVGDYVDWVPLIYGVSVEEWATWSGNLSVGLVSYWKFDETSGTNALDQIGYNNGTTSGATVNQAGKINLSYLYDGLNDKVAVTPSKINSTEGSLSLWFKKPNVNSTNPETLFGGGTGTSTPYTYLFLQSNTLNFIKSGSTSYNVNLSLTNNTWYHLVVTKNSTNGYAYLNGVKIYEGASTWFDTTYAEQAFGVLDRGTDYAYFNGSIDEAGYWNRSITQAEVSLLFNSNSGCSYGNETCFETPIVITAPTVTMNTVSQNLTSIQTTTINLTVKDAVKVQNVSLYVNGVLNQTNTSGLNNTNYLFNVTLGAGTYTILGNAWNNQTTNNVANSSAITIFVDSIKPQLALNYPTPLLNYSSVGSNLQLNFTATDTNLDKVGYAYSPIYITGTSTNNISIVNGSSTFKIFNTAWETGDKYDEYITIPSTCVNGSIIRFNYTYGDLFPSGYEIYTSCRLNNGSYYDLGNDVRIEGVLLEINTATSGTNILKNITLGTTKSVTLWANDTIGNINTTHFSWDYKVFENSRTIPTPVTETSLETFIINVTANTSLTSAYLNYNGIEYSASGIDGIYTKQLTIPSVGTTSIVPVYWRFDYSGENITSTVTNQTISKIIFQLCNATINKTLFNFTTKSATNPYPLVNTSFMCLHFSILSMGHLHFLLDR